METSTPKTSLEKVEAEIKKFIENPESNIEWLADLIFTETKGDYQQAKPILILLVNKLGMEKSVKITELILRKKSQSLKRMAIQRSVQFGTSRALKG
jgi:hypothetical protein